VLNAEKSGVESLINTQLLPKAEALKQLLDEYRYAIEIHKEANVISDFETTLQHDLFEKMHEEEESDDSFRIKGLFDAVFFKAIDGILNRILEATDYENLNTAYLTHIDFDVFVNGQAKTNNGKGYRAFLNTVVALALMEYLAEYGKYTPRMMVIDSPIQSLVEKLDDRTPDTMKTGLFKYLLEHQNHGQVIVVENILPPTLDYSGANMIEFTKGKKSGRYGLLLDVLC